MYIHTHILTSTYTHIHIHIHMLIYIYAYMHILIHIYISTYTHIYTYTLTHTLSQVYVQHLMKAHGANLIRQLTKQHAYLFVCGDGALMARDVMKCVEELLVEHAHMSGEEAKQYVLMMKKEARYVEDIWG